MHLLLMDWELLLKRLASALNDYFWYHTYECEKQFLSLIDLESDLKSLLKITF